MATGKAGKALAATSAEQVKQSLSMFEPRTLDELMKLADMVSKSDMVPKDYAGKPGNIIVAVQMGHEIGLKPLQALQSIAVINGRPCVWGDALPALVQASGLLEGWEERFETGKDADDYAAVCSATRKGFDRPFVHRFSVKDAKRAGLWGKAGTWTNYPQRMLQMRARSWVLRDGFADVLKGMRIREEEEDLVNVEAVVRPAVRTREDVVAEAAGLLERPLPPIGTLPDVPDEERAAIQGEAAAPPAPAKAERQTEGKLF